MSTREAGTTLVGGAGGPAPDEAFVAITNHRLGALERAHERVEARLNALLFGVAASIVVQIVTSLFR